MIHRHSGTTCQPSLVPLNAMSRLTVIPHRRSFDNRCRPLGSALALLTSLASTSCGAKPESRPSTISEMVEADPLEVWESRLTETIEQVRGSVVTLEYSASGTPNGPRRVASGVVISDDGDVLSVRIDPPSSSEPPGRASEILAHDIKGREFAASWVAADPETGLTLLKIEPGHARPAVPASRDPKVGIPILMIGNPFGLGHSVSRGFISGLNRRLILGPRQLGGLIQVDASFHPGDSGALLADLHGGWLGVVRSGLATPEAYPGEPGQAVENDHDLGFVIPSRDALWVAGQLKAHQRVNRAYLGITMANPADPLAVNHGVSESQGARLDRVIADTPADHAGLRSGDLILAFNGVAIRSAAELTDQLDRTLAKTPVVLDLVRRDDPSRSRETLSIVTAERPTFEATRLERPTPATPFVKASEKIEPAANAAKDIAIHVEQLEKRLRELEKPRNGSNPPR